jgi:hypothetical protein
MFDGDPVARISFAAVGWCTDRELGRRVDPDFSKLSCPASAASKRLGGSGILELKESQLYRWIEVKST